MVSFGVLFFSLVTAYGQVFDPHFALPLIGHFFLYEWAVEAIAWLSLAGILVLIGDPAEEPPALRQGRRAALALLRLDLVAGLLRRGDHPRRRRSAC